MEKEKEAEQQKKKKKKRKINGLLLLLNKRKTTLVTRWWLLFYQTKINHKNAYENTAPPVASRSAHPTGKKGLGEPSTEKDAAQKVLLKFTKKGKGRAVRLCLFFILRSFGASSRCLRLQRLLR